MEIVGFLLTCIAILLGGFVSNLIIKIVFESSYFESLESKSKRKEDKVVR